MIILALLVTGFVTLGKSFYLIESQLILCILRDLDKLTLLRF